MNLIVILLIGVVVVIAMIVALRVNAFIALITASIVVSILVPGARYYSISWIDGYGNLWLFGGLGYDASGSLGFLNDLWKFVYSKPAADADLNGDGIVNFEDYALLASHWLTGP